MTQGKILIFGRSGQVGWELRHKLACLGTVFSFDAAEVDFTKPDDIRRAVRGHEPAVIVNAAAYTAVDKAEDEADLAFAINGTAPGVLAEEAKRLGSIFVHYSTDYVFDGGKQGAYVETDSPSPLNVYGMSKLAGDEAIAAVGGDYLILRTSWVYGARGSNFLLTMLRLAKERPELKIVDDQKGAPTSSECIAQGTAQVLTQVLARGAGMEERSGIYNLACAGETSWFGFAKDFLTERDGWASAAKIIPIPTSEFPRPAKRPLNSRLSSKKIEEAFGVKIPDWREALQLVLETISMQSR